MDEQTFEFTYDGEMLQALFDKANALPSDPYVKPGLGIPDSDLAEEYAKKAIIGDLNDLETDVKDNLVDAINEAARFVGSALTGYSSLSGVEELPDVETTIGYLIDGDLYVWVGTGGDTMGGKYKNCGVMCSPSQRLTKSEIRSLLNL